MWPFIRKSEYKYDLLRPLSRFYNLLNVTGMLIVWTLVVFIVAVTYTYETSVDQMSVGTLIAIIIIAPLLASPCIVIAIHLFYRIYMDTIKKVFSKAYKPEKYMKDEEENDNSINCAIPVLSEQNSKSILFEEEKKQIPENEKSSSFGFEGGETEYFEDKADASKEMFPPIQRKIIPGQGFEPVADNIFHTESDKESLNKDEIKKRRITDNKSISESLNDNDLSVYEVHSDDKSKDGAQENVGLMESEARSNENLKIMVVFILLFSILTFSAAINLHIAFSLSSTIAGW